MMLLPLYPVITGSLAGLRPLGRSNDVLTGAKTFSVIKWYGRWLIGLSWLSQCCWLPHFPMSWLPPFPLSILRFIVRVWNEVQISRKYLSCRLIMICLTHEGLAAGFCLPGEQILEVQGCSTVVALNPKERSKIGHTRHCYV